MYKIVLKKELAPNIKLIKIEAPLIAKKVEPGQFAILRLHEKGERIPLTISDYNREQGTVTIIFQELGKTTKELGLLQAGDSVLDFAGPLGNKSDLEGFKKILCVGGGMGIAQIYPHIKKLHEMGAIAHVVIEEENGSPIILKEEIESICKNLSIVTSDGSKGLVTDAIKTLIDNGNKYDEAIVIGPLTMMKHVSILTKQCNLKTVVSLTPMMIDGTGMCGGCRVGIHGKAKFACVDGPEFYADGINFDELLKKQAMYKDKEKASILAHICNLEKDKTEVK